MKDKKINSFYNGVFSTITTSDVLNAVMHKNIKGYEKHFHKNSNGDYNHLMNFFIWKHKEKKSRYIRITLIGDNKKFYWNLERDFRPFAYKHNHRDGANEKSEIFLYDENDKYYNYLLNMLDRLK